MIKKFILKVFLIIMPFIFLAINYRSYEKSVGDLSILGKISIEKEYRKQIENNSLKSKKYFNLSELNLEKKNKMSIMTVGDSFSQHKNSGYQNYLASLDSFKILNFDGNTNDNPIQMAIELVNGDIFDSLKIDFLIVQSAERDFISRGTNINHDKSIKIDELKKKLEIKRGTNLKKKSEYGLSTFQDMLKYYLYEILYHFDDRAFVSKCYKVNLSKKLFSTKKNELLFYYEDIEKIEFNSRMDLIEIVNYEINILSNKLKQKGIVLILLLCPDKYDLYYPYIIKKNIPRNNFFDYYKVEKKDYEYIDSKSVLQDYLVKGEKDIYLADDTHWSPKAAEIIANEILNVINK